MKAYFKILIFLMSVLLVTAALAFKGQEASTEEPDVSQFPILEYKQTKSSSDSIAQRRSRKYNNRYAPKISESSDIIFTISDWEVGLPALPIVKSAAVIVGEVTEAQALLSEDETNVYCVFTIHINKILKNDGNFPLGIGHSVVVERLGGRVRLPSGKVLVSRTDKQDLPRVGKTYVLFLTRDIGTDDRYEDFHILTGYELHNGKVSPLDRLTPGHPITTYTGVDEKVFFSDLNRVLGNPSAAESH